MFRILQSEYTRHLKLIPRLLGYPLDKGKDIGVNLDFCWQLYKITSLDGKH